MQVKRRRQGTGRWGVQGEGEERRAAGKVRARGGARGEVWRVERSREEGVGREGVAAVGTERRGRE